MLKKTEVGLSWRVESSMQKLVKIYF